MMKKAFLGVFRFDDESALVAILREYKDYFTIDIEMTFTIQVFRSCSDGPVPRGR